VREKKGKVREETHKGKVFFAALSRNRRKKRGEER
jgi:hypothetical protein